MDRRKISDSTELKHACFSIGFRDVTQLENIFSVIAWMSKSLAIFISYIFCILFLFSASLRATSGKTADELLEEARQFISKDMQNEAMQSMQAAVSLDESNILVRFKRALMLINMGRNQNALTDLDLVLRDRPEFEQAMLQRAKIHLRKCSFDEAFVDLNKLQGKQEHVGMIEEAGEARRAYDAAKSLLPVTAANADQLLELLNKVTVVCLQDGDLRMLKAEVYETKGDITSAVGEYNRASHLKNDNIAACLKLAELHSRLGEIDQALGAVIGCLHLDPEHNQCSKQFKKLKRISKAMDKAKEAMARGRFREALGPDALDSDKAGDKGVLPVLDALQITEGSIRIEALNMVCQCYTKLKRTQDALKWCQLAVNTSNNQDVDTFCNLADILLQTEEFEKAVQTFSRAQELPGGQQSQRVGEGLHKAQQLLRQSKKKDYYKILNIDRQANEREIKNAFRKLAREYHPDKYQGDNAELAEKKMAEINQAYEVLSNEELRRRFDAGDDPNDPEQGHGGHHHHGGFHGQPVFFQQGGSPFGGHGGGGGNHQNFEFRFF